MLCDNCKCEINVRTLQQNSALHLYFTLLAEALNESGNDMRSVIRQEVDIPWTPETIKRYLWKPLQKAYLGHDRTSNLKTSEVNKVYDILNKTIGERTGVSILFPSSDYLLSEEI